MTTGTAQAGVEIYRSDFLRARFVDLGSDRVIVSFPDRVHPAELDEAGWGEAFLSSRKMSAVYITLANIDWYQCPDFFDMLAAIRAHLGPDVPLTTYGSSMGGYGALLASKTLGADMCFAMVPQYSIDPKVVPFERRYKSEFKKIGAFIHDLDAHVCPSCQYFIAFDPTHASDRKHAALIKRSFNPQVLPVYGARHAVIVYLVEVKAHKSLALFLSGQADLKAVRSDARRGRARSHSYLRVMSKRAYESGHAKLCDYAQVAKKNGFNVLAHKISERMSEMPKAAQKKAQSSRRLILHIGLPKTGTSSLQAHFYQNASGYEKQGLHYPTVDISKADLNHAWSSQALRNADTEQLKRTLANVPAECDTVLLSNESLYVDLPGFTDAALSKFAKELKGWDVEVVAFKRDMEEWKRTFYMQSIQNGRGKKLEARVTARDLWSTGLKGEAFFQLPYVKELLAVDDLIERFAKDVNAKKVHTLDYIKGKDSTELFCECVGVDKIPETVQMQRNPSLTDVDAEILRQVHSLNRGGKSRFAKQLVEGRLARHPKNMQEKKRAFAIKQARAMQWQRLTFTSNPPLTYSEKEFTARVDELRTMSDNFLKAIKE